jgi:L-seryl-tRNA(Ser) seleniumtransferase
MIQDYLRQLPSVDSLMSHPALQEARACGHDLARYAARQAIEHSRMLIKKGAPPPGLEQLAARARRSAHDMITPALRPAINATGVILNTNLGRAPLGKALLRDIAETLPGYANLEFDLSSGKRGSRTDLLRPLLRFITGAQDIAIVNNNAAAVMLCLGTLARGKEVVVSRGELIEIGGAFRMPDIMAASGAIMTETGTTNRTRIDDYEKALSDNTALLFKAHKSNYDIRGFTEETSIEELCALGKKRSIPVVYDIGSGLLRKPRLNALAEEPDVQSAVRAGANLVTFSGDKLLGGPQAGIIAGDQELVARCARAPLMRALRVGKLTIAALSAACRHYLSDADLRRFNPLFYLLEQPLEHVQARAERLAAACGKRGVATDIATSRAQAGGGTLPGLDLPSAAVVLKAAGSPRTQQQFAEKMHAALLSAETPVIGVLREGRLELDGFCIADDQIDTIAHAVSQAAREIGS